MNFDEIKELIKLVSKTGLGKVQIEKEDFQLTISGNKNSKAEQPIIVQSPQPMMAAPAPAAPAPLAEAPAKEKPAVPAEDDNLITVNSPMIGTFYRSPGPDKDSFVNVGSTFQVGDKLCIIEAMKTFNEIEAEVSGKIVKVLVDDASPVDYDQPLFLVEPLA
ncbi:acetyl-CoA carboxylase biotin carboxyl carrier protein [Crocinitomicaceae bacterium]|jgi:acetyl-CoA carboxylase biotin carboxyl carrier protein|nr:acetyl-CoA carboxylase biotin carboxyl carrier protein [Crocinitomicaceae bacterium]MDB4649608.1 acetyl-CoA carboxylase biotin carboxyl carrier protein [Crocinitomicaceae bacterium]